MAERTIVIEAFSWKGAWSAFVAYGIGDTVSYDDSLYVCVLPCINHEPPNSEYWNVLMQGRSSEEGAAGPYIVLVDKEDSFTYYGFALPGSATSDPVWRILREEDFGDGDYGYLYADGDSEFDNVWDDRVILKYN